MDAVYGDINRVLIYTVNYSQFLQRLYKDCEIFTIRFFILASNEENNHACMGI